MTPGAFGAESKGKKRQREPTAEPRTGEPKRKQGRKQTRAEPLTIAPCAWPSEQDDSEVLAPYCYTAALPASGSRDKLIDALDHWYRVPADALATIRSIVRLMHNASLLLDDVEDDSRVRRGSPSAHVVFGVAQTINSASFVIVKGVELARQLGEVSLSCFLGELGATL